ncbi:MAG: hypothetical protein WBM13_12860 [Bacteroidia bacterium]
MEENKEDLKKYFNPKEYITKIIGVESAEDEAESIGEEKINNLINLLVETTDYKLKEQALLTLKKEKGEELLLVAIASDKAKEKRHRLVAACWESEINFSKYLPFFVLLAIDNDYLVSLEAITVISTMEGPFDKKQLEEALVKVKNAKQGIASERVVLLNDLTVTLEDLLRNQQA